MAPGHWETRADGVCGAHHVPASVVWWSRTWDERSDPAGVASEVMTISGAVTTLRAGDYEAQVAAVAAVGAPRTLTTRIARR